ncbi:MAG: glycosyltransferase family 4 protein [Acidobacteria bacterium]|nr:glycosyltransferase family 4 protein [Acidobacteriota bacterium]
MSAAASERPRTILYAAWAPFFSGAERALLILLDALDRTRFTPIVAVGTHADLAREIEARGIACVHVPVAYADWKRLPAWGASVSRMVALLRRERVALVHANDVPSFQPAGYAARLLGVPAITHVRFPDSADGFAWFLRPGFARALFVSAALEAEARSAAPDLFAGRSEVVHDGVREAPAADDDTRRALRHELGLPADRMVVAITGQVSVIKGIWEFLDAAERLVKEHAPATFVVLGDDLKGQGALRRDAEARVKERGLGAHVRFLGFRPDAPRLLPAFDVVAVPSHVEPLGNATLEAMAAGVPVVGSRVGGIPEMIVPGETGLLVPPRDADALAAAIGALVRDPDRARALGRAGQRRARTAFSPEAHAARVAAIYDAALASSPGSRNLGRAVGAGA